MAAAATESSPLKRRRQGVAALEAVAVASIAELGNLGEHAVANVEVAVLQVGTLRKEPKPSCTVIVGDKSGIVQCVLWDSVATRMATVLQDKLEEDADGFPGVSLKGFQVRRLASVAGMEVVKLQSTPRSLVEVQAFMEVKIQVKSNVLSDFAQLEVAKAPFMVHLMGRVMEVSELGEASSGTPMRGASLLSNKGEVVAIKVHGDLASHELLVVGQPVFAFYVDIKVSKDPKAAATAFLWSDSYLLSAGPIVTENLDSKRMVELK